MLQLLGLGLNGMELYAACLMNVGGMPCDSGRRIVDSLAARPTFHHALSWQTWDEYRKIIWRILEAESVICALRIAML